MDVADGLRSLIETVRSDERFLVTTHVSADGDAIGSAAAFAQVLRDLGKDVVVVHNEGQPTLYPFIDTSSWQHDPPADLAERTVIALDCASRSRVACKEIFDGKLVVNFDHHRTNDRWGALNVVGPWSSTAVGLAELFAGLGITVGGAVAEALYTGAFTDTNELTTASPAEAAAAGELLAASGRANGLYGDLTRKRPEWEAYAERAAERAVPSENGITVSRLQKEDLAACGLDADNERGAFSLAGRRVQTRPGRLHVFLYERSDGTQNASLKSVDPAVDCGAIADALGGGGHQGRAGISGIADAAIFLSKLEAEWERMQAKPSLAGLREHRQAVASEPDVAAVELGE